MGTNPSSKAIPASAHLPTFPGRHVDPPLSCLPVVHIWKIRGKEEIKK
jgi:hypothetical protein